ncbi:MAG: PD40 domain-containing protein [Candidatus Kerfeldbacteria bacterium]|nr:PD40 domain-containing protein [Candidatus Kerfeldbacteria bacterium]
MTPTLRRILLIAAFVLVTLAFFYVIYLVFFKPTPIVPVNNGVGNVNGLPTVGNGNVNRVGLPNANALPIVNAVPPGQQPSNVAEGGLTITDTVVPGASSDLTVGGKGLRFYDRDRGQFYELSPDGTTKTLLTDDVYRSVSDIDWSPNGQQAILSFPDNSKVLYDFEAKKQTTLPRELNDFFFSPQSDQIVSKFLNPTNADDQWLLVSRPDGSQSETVEHLGENASRVTTAWSPNNQIIATYRRSTTGELSEIIFLGAKGENFRSATIEGKGFTPLWSPDGRRLLYSAYSPNTNDNPHLYIMDGSPDSLGTNLVDLGLDTTADKCAFSQSAYTIYCAVPYYLNAGSGPQPELSAGVPDNIYRVDLLSGSAEIIARPVDRNGNQRFSAANLRLSPREDLLYFVDAATGTIQKIQLR